ncbi:MAG: hypothetical protein IJ191_10350 [Treponema sp.]|nr:hypothetical protein [Treponema sp.]
MDAFTERKSERFSDFGRAFAPDLCPLPGVLDDVSLHGCKVHFPLSVTVDFDNDYPLIIQPSSQRDEKLELLCHPQWSKQDGGVTDIGFSILPSHDYTRFTEYIGCLMHAALPQESQIVGSVCHFV